jgi:hypothetical protein
MSLPHFPLLHLKVRRAERPSPKSTITQPVIETAQSGVCMQTRDVVMSRLIQNVRPIAWCKTPQSGVCTQIKDVVMSRLIKIVGNEQVD